MKHAHPLARSHVYLRTLTMILRSAGISGGWVLSDQVLTCVSIAPSLCDHVAAARGSFGALDVRRTTDGIELDDHLMGHTSHAGRRASVLVLLILLLPSSLSAQGKSHGYVSLGAGATYLNGGLDWVIGGGPIAIGGEVGVGWVFLAAITGSYHFLPSRPRKHDLFATIGYMGLGSSEFSSQGVTVGGGATYWPTQRLGLRLDGFRFLPVATDNSIPAEERSPSRYWGLRAGVAFRFR